MYQVNLFDHFKWEQKDRYFLLMINYLNKQINTVQCLSQLFKPKN